MTETSTPQFFLLMLFDQLAAKGKVVERLEDDYVRIQWHPIAEGRTAIQESVLPARQLSGAEWIEDEEEWHAQSRARPRLL